MIAQIDNTPSNGMTATAPALTTKRNAYLCECPCSTTKYVYLSGSNECRAHLHQPYAVFNLRYRSVVLMATIKRPAKIGKASEDKKAARHV